MGVVDMPDILALEQDTGKVVVAVNNMARDKFSCSGEYI